LYSFEKAQYCFWLSNLIKNRNENRNEIEKYREQSLENYKKTLKSYNDKTIIGRMEIFLQIHNKFSSSFEKNIEDIDMDSVVLNHIEKNIRILEIFPEEKKTYLTPKIIDSLLESLVKLHHSFSPSVVHSS
jgi:hypothetical protein